MSQSKKNPPIKVKWELVPAADADDRIKGAFDIIFGHIEEQHPDTLYSSADSDTEAQEIPGQLPLF